MSTGEQGSANYVPIAAEEDPAELGLGVPAPDAADWDPTDRNRYIRKVCEGLTRLESLRHSGGERRGGHGGNKGDAGRQERKVARNLAKACGGCGLQDGCEVADDMKAWHSAHQFAHVEHPGLETREGLLQRVKADPQAPCLLPEA